MPPSPSVLSADEEENGDEEEEEVGRDNAPLQAVEGTTSEISSPTHGDNGERTEESGEGEGKAESSASVDNEENAGEHL